MFGFLRKPSPPAPDYAALADYDDARLLAGSGSELLDALLRVPAADRRWDRRLDTIPEAAALREAAPAARGDVFARLCALVYGRDGETARARAEAMPYNYESLKHLCFSMRNSVMSLPSAVALRFIKPAPGSQRAGVQLALESPSRALSDEALIFVKMALRANEPKRDPAFDRLLRQSLADFALDFRSYGRNFFPAALTSARACLEALGEDVGGYAPARAFADVKQAASAALDRWRRDLPPDLWRYFACCAGLPEAKDSHEAELLAALTESPPPARGALLERLHALNDEANRQLPGLPWTLDRGMDWLSDAAGFRWRGTEIKVLRHLPRALREKRCDLSPDFALLLVQSTDALRCSDSVAFVRSLAAALPRTAQAREAVEQRFAEVRGHGAAEMRALEKQKTILLDALAEAKAPQDLESRAAEARARFETALAAARETLAAVCKQEAETRARFAKAGASDALLALRAISRLTRPGERVESRLGGYDGPFELLALAVAPAKFAPLPPTWAGRLQDIEDDTSRSRREAGLPAGRDAFVSEPLPAEYRALDAARAALALFAPLTAPQREVWLAAEDLAAHAPSSAAPSGKWAKAAQTLARSPEAATVRNLLLALAAAPEFLHGDAGKSVLGHTPPLRRALVWQLAFHPAAEVAKPLGELALRALAPSPQGGLTNELIGNAALWVLSELAGGAGLPVLARIGARSRYPKVRQRIGTLFEEAARKAGRARAEIEEEIAPHHGFDAAGVSRYPLAAGAAEFSLGARGKAEIVWRDEAGKALKAPSAAMKLADPAGLKAAREAVREIETDYGVQAKRVETLYRSTRALDYARWREFYVEHPFVGLVARRLIWRAGDVVGLWRDGGFEDVGGERHDIEAAKLTLWHPIEAGEAEIAAWRDRLAALEIDQPFRQAWRETYRVTDAERLTGCYSNRFAGHIVRQHQFMALARLNDWSCRHRMWQDVANTEPTFVVFPEHDVYAEYWTAGFGGEEPSVADSTAYLYLTTDRVAFHRINPEAPPNRPMALRGARLDVDEVPAIVFSEILRCCDLFVSVASIARDAQWLDRGRDARHPSSWHGQADAYWRAACEEPLQANAELRRELLARLLPALGAGERLRLDDRRLHVRGVRGAYAIHLGSGAAFHASGQHICIVPNGAPKGLVLPYEGDETLALIVSKAMLLLRDDKIIDPVILRQL